MKNYPHNLLRAVLLRRINRFVAEISLNGNILNVYVPNTGRLSELALPGTEVLLSEINTKYKYKILYIINRSFPVMIDSSYSNRLFRILLEDHKVPLPFDYNSVKNEPVFGNHRFDFILGREGENSFIELKSCTLFHRTTGAFPDAVSQRASEHVKELAKTGGGIIVFFVLRSDIEKFIPNYHTDFHFYETLKEYRNIVNPRAYTVQYDSSLNISSLNEIPVFIPEVAPGGVFMVIIFNSEDQLTGCGAFLKKGFYIYCGYDTENIFKAVSSFRRKFSSERLLPGTKPGSLKIISDIPIVDNSVTTEFVLSILKIHGASFQFSDENNACVDTVYFSKNPAESSWFWNAVLEMRFGKYS